MKKTVFLLTLVFFIFQISQVSAQKVVSIKGKILENYHTKIKLENILQEEEIAEAFIGENGEFELTASIETVDYFQLSLDANTYILLVLSPGENVTITFNTENPEESIIEGSPGTQVY